MSHVGLHKKYQYSGSNIISSFLHRHLTYIYACPVMPILSQEILVLVEGVGIIYDEFHPISAL